MLVLNHSFMLLQLTSALVSANSSVLEMHHGWVGQLIQCSALHNPPVAPNQPVPASCNVETLRRQLALSPPSPRWVDPMFCYLETNTRPCLLPAVPSSVKVNRWAGSGLLWWRLQLSIDCHRSGLCLQVRAMVPLIPASVLAQLPFCQQGCDEESIE